MGKNILGKGILSLGACACLFLSIANMSFAQNDSYYEPSLRSTPNSTSSTAPSTTPNATSNNDRPGGILRQTTAGEIEAKQKNIEEKLKKAEELIKSKGKKKAFAEFNKKEGEFTKSPYYIFATDYNGKLLANPFEEKLVGNNIVEMKDLNGKFFVKEMIDKAKAGGGTVIYRWTNPVSNLIECKSAVIKPVEGDFFIGMGYYFPPSAEGKCE